MALINQKEYLKKYLAPNKSHKKKKKKKADSSRIKIIDDDLDVEATFNEAVNEDLLLMEDAPQIVGVTDDRPLNMRLSDYNNDRWKRVNTNDQTNSPGLEQESKKQEDHSPVRRNKHDSPPPRNRRDSIDNSPPRARNKVSNDNDNSPPRQRTKTEIIEIDNSPPRRKSKSDDNSPPRRRRKYSDGDNSPPRQRQKSHHDRSSHNSKRNSPDRNRNKETGRSRQYSQDNSPPRRSSSTKRDSSPERPRKEPSFLPVQIKREREDSVASQRSFKSPVVNNEPMAAPQTIVRDRKTGRIRDLRQEALDSKEKQKEKSVITEKYTRWGKGVKQVEDANEKMSDALHEMQKPLARYVDDDDLESFLKSREREGDPMLQYLKKKNNKNKGPEKPKYEGDCGPPNRYSIRPGFRWDGVNRSNGFETKYFEVQNAKRASQEDAYKWNSEDL